MPMFTWGSRFCLGIDSIDRQHETLVNYLNQLYDAMLRGETKDAVKPILDGLISYTANHFAYEEKIFAKHAYADATAHRKEHDDLKGKVIAFQKEFDAGKATVSNELMGFLKDWLQGHILGSDKKYAPVLIAKGEK